MKKKTLALLASVSLLFGLPLPAQSAGCSLSGSGSSGDPYLVSTRSELASIINCDGVGKTFKLTQSIDLGGTLSSPATHWTPLGTEADPFIGILDGDGHSISGLAIEGQDSNYALFGFVKDSTFTDFALVGEVVSAEDKVALLAGSAIGDITVARLQLQGKLTGDDRIGALIGEWTNEANGQAGTVFVSDVDLRVSILMKAAIGLNQNQTSDYVGGLIGRLDNVGDEQNLLRIENLRGDVAIEPAADRRGENVGGLVGLLEGRLNVSNVALNVEIETQNLANGSCEYIGGLLGRISGSEPYTLTVSSTHVSGSILDPARTSDCFGGFFGAIRSELSSSSITNSTFSGVVSARKRVGGISGDVLSTATTPQILQLSGVQSFGSVIGAQIENGDGSPVGGLIGEVVLNSKSSLTISKSANYAKVTNAEYQLDNSNLNSYAFGLGGAIGQVVLDHTVTATLASETTEVIVSEFANYGVIATGGHYAAGVIGRLANRAGAVVVSDTANHGPVKANELAAGVIAGSTFTRAVSGGSPSQPMVGAEDLSQARSNFDRVLSTGLIQGTAGTIFGLFGPTSRIDGNSYDYEISQANSMDTAVWDTEASSVAADTSSATDGLTTGDLTSTAPYTGRNFDLDDGWDPANHVWGRCANFNDGYPFLNAVFGADPCQAGFEVVAPDVSFTQLGWDFTSVWNSCPAVDSGRAFLRAAYSGDPCIVPVGYTGPIVSLSSQSVSPGETLEVAGQRLSSVTQAIAGGVELELISVASEGIVLRVPANAIPGLQDLVLVSSFGRLVIQDALRVLELPTAAAQSEVVAWTKKISDTEIKFYAKNLVGVGKVQFFVNGREIAWVRAEDENDPKLRGAAGSSYLVRTVKLVQGEKTVFEAYVNGERVRRAAYSLR